MSRTEFSRKVRAAAFLRCAGLCEGCGARLKTGEAEYDHELPDALEGPATLENCKVLCRVCHKGKTASDLARIRKADRQRDRHTGAMPRAKVKIPTRPKRSRPHRDRPPMPGPELNPLYRLWAVGNGDTE